MKLIRSKLFNISLKNIIQCYNHFIYLNMNITIVENSTIDPEPTVPYIKAVTYTVGQDLFAIIVVVLTSAIGGILVSMLAGWHYKKFLFIPAINIKPAFTKFKLPPLIGMIVFGCFAHNCFGREVRAYSEKWAATIREICLTLLLIRGGLAISFKGKGLLVLILTVVPQTVEAFVGACVACVLFNMPFGIAYTLGYTLSCISPSVIVPCLVGLLERGYGKSKGIPTAIIAAGTFDDILTIVNNGICASIAFTKIDNITGEPKESVPMDILKILFEILVGLIVGVGIGLIGWLFKFIQ
jgi:NhaP-type Na+/H+ or K+/H+ antiporter